MLVRHSAHASEGAVVVITASLDETRATLSVRCATSRMDRGEALSINLELVKEDNVMEISTESFEVESDPLDDIWSGTGIAQTVA